MEPEEEKKLCDTSPNREDRDSRDLHLSPYREEMKIEWEQDERIPISLPHC
jgi:hypothetical protein